MPDKLEDNGLAQHHGYVPGKEMRSPGTETLGDTQDETNQEAHETGSKTPTYAGQFASTMSYCTNECTCFLTRDLTDTGQEKHGQSDDASPDEWQKVDPAAYKRLVGVTVEHSKDGMVMELLQMYSAQHDKLQSTQRRQKQLEKVFTPD